MQKNAVEQEFAAQHKMEAKDSINYGPPGAVERNLPTRKMMTRRIGPSPSPVRQHRVVGRPSGIAIESAHWFNNYRLTRTRSATAGESERRLQWMCFHKVKRGTTRAGGWLHRLV